MELREYIQSGIIESYVLGLATEDEAAELEKLAALHPEIRKAVDDFSEKFEMTIQAEAVTPPAGLKKQVLASLQLQDGLEETNTPDAPVVPVDFNGQYKSIKMWKYAAAASIILLLGSAALNMYFYNNYNSVNNQYQALLLQRNSLQANNNLYKARLQDYTASLQVMEDPAVVSIKLVGVNGRQDNQATVYWNRDTKEVYFNPDKMAEVPEDKQFQLWALVDGKPVNAGVINDCNGLCKMEIINEAQAFAVTLEKKGGSEAPTLSEMYVMGKV